MQPFERIYSLYGSLVVFCCSVRFEIAILCVYLVGSDIGKIEVGKARLVHCFILKQTQADIGEVVRYLVGLEPHFVACT